MQRIAFIGLLLAACKVGSSDGLGNVCANGDEKTVAVAGYLMVVEGAGTARTILVENPDGSGRFVGIDSAPMNLPPPNRVARVTGRVQRSEAACSIRLESVNLEEK